MERKDLPHGTKKLFDTFCAQRKRHKKLLSKGGHNWKTERAWFDLENSAVNFALAFGRHFKEFGK